METSTSVAEHQGHAPPGGDHSGSGDSGPYRAATHAAWRWGILAALGLAMMYGVTLSLLNGLAYALDTFLALWYWMTPLVTGFAVQVGMYGYSRSLARAGVSPHASGVVASGGASAVSMVACCAHHLTEVLPLMGFAGVTLFLSSYQTVFLLAGVLSNLVGITFLLGEMQRHHLYAPQGRLLPWVMRLPVRRALPYVAAVAVIIMAIEIYWEVWA